MRGRPRKETARDSQYKLRLTAKEKNILDCLSIESGKPKSEIVREALKMYYNLAKYQN